MPAARGRVSVGPAPRSPLAGRASSAAASIHGVARSGRDPPSGRSLALSAAAGSVLVSSASLCRRVAVERWRRGACRDMLGTLNVTSSAH